MGTSTIGSSEACMLGGLALKWRWREKMRKAGKPADRPNLVMGTNTQVCWHKFVRYWDVEERAVPLEGDQCVTDPERAAAACDENTIGVVAVLGSTFTGDYENVERLSAALDVCRRRPDWIFRFTWMARAELSWRRSCSRTCCGISACRA